MTPPSSFLQFAIVAIVAAATTLPLLLARFPIAQDLPAHVETAAQILALWRGDPAVVDVYQLHGQPWPNALPVLLLAPLLGVIDGLSAAKLLVGLTLLAWPLSLALLLHRLGRSPILALLLLPTSFDLSFGYGFLHFLVGKPLWALALVAAFDVARGATVRRLLRLCVVLALLFATHLMLFATAVPLCAVVVVVCATGWRTRLRAGLATVAGAAPALSWAAQQKSQAGKTVFPAPLTSLQQLWSNLGDLHSGSLDGVPWVLCALGVAGVALLPGLRSSVDKTRALPRTTVAVGLIAVGVVAFAWLGPVRLPQVSVVAERFWSLGAALLVCVPPLLVNPRGALVVVVVGALAAGVITVDVTGRWRAFSATDMGDFDALLQKIPPGSRIATHYVNPFSTSGRHNALWHWGKLSAQNGSVTDDNFAWRSTCVVGLKPGRSPLSHPTLSNAELKNWDFLLVRGSSAAADRTLLDLRLSLVMSTGSWRLFAVHHD